MTEFWVQERAAELWHQESDEDCELMLCGLRISVDAPASKVQNTPGQRRCPDCWMKSEQLRKIRALKT